HRQADENLFQRMIKMTGSLFVSGLHQDVTEKLLQANFHSFGPICSVQVCKTKITNSSCGYGFVTFKYCQDAEKALKCLNFRTLLVTKMVLVLVNNNNPVLKRKKEKKKIWRI
uniref:RRM domain-containing protein n=1 Tax=Cyprinus carpio TaxID=7962 RepID=A0A8C2QAK2_CYPCA